MIPAPSHSLAKLCAGLPAAKYHGRPDGVIVRSITTDSRKVRPGALFVCLRGAQHDGHAFVPKAVRDGAVAAVAERPLRHAIPVVQVPDSRQALAHLAASFWGYPSRFMDVAGITGTNGKTTTAYMLESVLALAGRKPALFGTVDYRFGKARFPHVHTTAEANDLQGLFAKVRRMGALSISMEVSSHALALGRVEGTFFQAGIFTNLTQDHLDFHRTMRRYFLAKAGLFRGLADRSLGGIAVINWDSAAGRQLARLTKARIIRYGTKSESVEVSGSRIRPGAAGTSFLMRIGRKTTPVRLRLLGAHNVLNALAAAGAAYGLGVETEDIARGLARLGKVPGRMERVPLRSPFLVIVDYAHTPDALAHLLKAARPLGRRRLITVFGCGGNRDRGKRPKMGRIAGRLSGRVWVTSDNPRREDPMGIIRDILAGTGRNGKFRVEPDRRRAIAGALKEARSGDVVVIAGKGHEKEQIVNDRRLPFDDIAVAREEWRKVNC